MRRRSWRFLAENVVFRVFSPMPTAESGNASPAGCFSSTNWAGAYGDDPQELSVTNRWSQRHDCKPFRGRRRPFVVGRRIRIRRGPDSSPCRCGQRLSTPIDENRSAVMKLPRRRCISWPWRACRGVSSDAGIVTRGIVPAREALARVHCLTSRSSFTSPLVGQCAARWSLSFPKWMSSLRAPERCVSEFIDSFSSTKIRTSATPVTWVLGLAHHSAYNATQENLRLLPLRRSAAPAGCGSRVRPRRQARARRVRGRSCNQFRDAHRFGILFQSQAAVQDCGTSATPSSRVESFPPSARHLA